MLHRLILAAALAAGLASPAAAQVVQVIPACGLASAPLGPGGRLYTDTTGTLCTVGGSGSGGGSGGATGSVTAAGQNGGAAQAIQGINGGVPVNGFTGQYNSTLPTLASGATGYLAVDNNGRQILSPSSSVSVSNFPATQAVSGTVSVGNFPASQAVTNAGTFAVQNTAPLPAGTNVIGKVGIDQTTPGTTNGVQVTNQSTQTTTGALQPPTAGAGKITRTSTALTASTSTTIAAANASRIAMGIQCGSGAVSIDETGAALTAAGVGNGTLFMPSGSAPYFTPPIASQTAVTAYTATAQTCVVTEYNR